jgi:hypothetical protein
MQAIGFRCGTFGPARMREQVASDNPVAAAISLSVNASSFGAISRLNQVKATTKRPCRGCLHHPRR